MKTIVHMLTVTFLLVGCSKKAAEKSKNGNEVGETASANAMVRSTNSISNTKRLEVGTPLQTNALPEHVRAILRYPAMKLLPDQILALKPEDGAVLLAQYRRESELTNKRASTVALSFIGDAETVEEFKNTLLRTRSERVLNRDERSIMFLTVEGLGLLARQHDSAFQFLTNAIDPRFWNQNVQWRVEMGESAMAGRALTSLSQSQRPEVDEILQRMRESPFISNQQGGGWFLGSDVVDAAFWRDLTAARGPDYLKTIHGTDQTRSEFQAWADSPTGKEWRTWRRQWEKDHPKEAGLLPPQ